MWGMALTAEARWGVAGKSVALPAPAEMAQEIDEDVVNSPSPSKKSTRIAKCFQLRRLQQLSIDTAIDRSINAADEEPRRRPLYVLIQVGKPSDDRVWRRKFIFFFSFSSSAVAFSIDFLTATYQRKKENGTVSSICFAEILWRKRLWWLFAENVYIFTHSYTHRRIVPYVRSRRVDPLIIFSASNLEEFRVRFG